MNREALEKCQKIYDDRLPEETEEERFEREEGEDRAHEESRGLTIEIVPVDELTKQQTKEIDAIRGWSYDDTHAYDGENYILIYYKNKLIFVENDKMEPEDVTFYRDLSWIEEALEKCFTLGYRHKLMEGINE